MKNVKGFTLIELIIVVVLLGLLAAAALPKFADLESKAKSASEQGIIGAIRAAIGISHADWLANGKSATITLEGTTITMSTQGYPEYTNTAGTPGTMVDGKCLEVYNGILFGAPSASATKAPPSTTASLSRGGDRFRLWLLAAVSCARPRALMDTTS